MDQVQIRNILEGALMAAGRPLNLDELAGLFPESERPDKAMLRSALGSLGESLEERSVELVEVASGWRVQVRRELSDWVSRLWEDKPPRYSRALLETLALVAYRQPITRGDIEEIRGVSVSSNIIRTLQERGWVRVVGHRDVPGRPEMLGTTREFLDYFGLTKLEDLPTLAELRDLDTFHPELDFGEASDGDEGPDSRLRTPDVSPSEATDRTADDKPNHGTSSAPDSRLQTPDETPTEAPDPEDDPSAW